MALDLEIAAVVREVAEGEEPPVARTPMVRQLRDSHHQVARLVAQGMREAQIAAVTGYALSRISTLKNDPAFQELVAAYRFDQADVRADLEERYRQIGNDFAQRAHEILLDEPEAVSLSAALEAFKTFADRGGMSPVSRSLNKNMNLNIGARLDEARKRREG